MKNNFIKIFDFISQPLLCLLLIAISLFGSVKWAQFNAIFIVEDVKIEGINYFDDTMLIEYKTSIKNQNIFFSNLKDYKNDIKSLDHIKDCKVSRVFPKTIKIEIYEREPLAMISSNDLIILDSEGVCLPVEYCEISLPILSNFKNNQELYEKGKKTKSSNVLKSIDVIKYSKDNFASLYDNISEFVFNEDSEYEIILKNGRTKILLGSDNIFAKIDYLNAFANILPETKKLESYRYIDLRYKRQIVVNEI
ncbi:MAG: FtsQ-type POTRA domain-containing protein [bacterium]|jgi:cell division septal protein FtsQ|nr:FtsQ-type POTRA domain-containing protein [Candidatus Neomarinimicrobiota bacterium]HIL86277.1 FtsQ-type POTRA domain-containing protein [Candidatus Neomarinimicrobiota bacterium]